MKGLCFHLTEHRGCCWEGGGSLQQRVKLINGEVQSTGSQRSDKVPSCSKFPVVVEMRGTHHMHGACSLSAGKGKGFCVREGEGLNRSICG